MVVVSRLNPVRFNGGDIPSIVGFERRSPFFLGHGVRTRSGTIVTEAQPIKGCIVLRHRRQTRHVFWPLVAVEGVEQPAVQHRLKLAPKPLPATGLATSSSHANPQVSLFLRLIHKARRYPGLRGGRAIPHLLRFLREYTLYHETSDHDT